MKVFIEILKGHDTNKLFEKVGCGYQKVGK